MMCQLILTRESDISAIQQALDFWCYNNPHITEEQFAAAQYVLALVEENL